MTYKKESQYFKVYKHWKNICIFLSGFALAAVLLSYDPLVHNEMLNSTELTTPPTDSAGRQIRRVSNMTQSTCSEGATLRGLNQRVVSFCFYGAVNNTQRDYFKGVEANAALVREKFPGWVMRVYHDLPSNDANIMKYVKESQERYKHLDFCDSHNLPGYGDITALEHKSWRFMPLADPTVDVFISRDLDSRISDREATAVEKWMDSGLTFHVMRDHPHHGVYVLGGMWGARVEKERFLLVTLMMKLFVRGWNVGKRRNDQDLLKLVAWPFMKDDVLQHDSFHCRKFSKHGGMSPWSTRRVNEPLNFVGSVLGMNDGPLKNVCPVECRPLEHQDWINC